MLYRKIMAVCSEIHTKHINTLCGQNVANCWMLNPLCTQDTNRYTNKHGRKPTCTFAIRRYQLYQRRPRLPSCTTHPWGHNLVQLSPIHTFTPPAVSVSINPTISCTPYRCSHSPLYSTVLLSLCSPGRPAGGVVILPHSPILTLSNVCRFPPVTLCTTSIPITNRNRAPHLLVQSPLNIPTELSRLVYSTRWIQNSAGHPWSSAVIILWRRNYFFFIIQEPNTLDLWNKLHFE